MFALIRLAFLSCLAVLAGVAAVSLPVMGKTVAEHVHDLAAPYLDDLARKARDLPAPGLGGAPSLDEITDEDRMALDRILGDRAGER